MVCLMVIPKLLAIPKVAFTKDYIGLDWSDLVPESETVSQPVGLTIIEHDQSNLISEQPASSGIRTEWNGKKSCR